jgi:hypothetical protein
MPPVAAPAPVEVQEEEEEDWRPASQAEPSRDDGGRKLRPAMWTTLGLAALCGIGAGITGGLAIKAQSDFDDAVAASNSPSASDMMRHQARTEGLDASKRADTLAVVTDVLWVSAAVGATTAFVLWLVDRKHAGSDQSVALLPATSARGDAHLFLRGAF